MKRTSLQKIIFISFLLFLIAAGCNQPLDLSMQRNRIFLMGRLLVSKTCDVRVIWRKAPEEQIPVTVTADLSEIGGSAEQELLATDNGTWRWAGQVAPDISGERVITITAIDAREQKKEVSKRFPVFNTEKAVAIGAGSDHRLAVKADGAVVAWGCEDLYPSDNLGQCDVPPAITDAVAVAGGVRHSIVLYGDGTMAAWGKYYKPVPDNDSVIIPMGVPEGLSDIVAIDAHHNHNLVLKADGSVVAWGGNLFGECDVPEDVTDVIAISTGYDSSFALRADGSLVSWGAAAAIENINAVAVSAGSMCPLVLNEYGKAYLDGRAESFCVDVPVRANRGFRAIAAGGGNAGSGMGLQMDGTVVSWTYRNSHESHYYVNEGPNNVLSIAIGQYSDFRLALAEDGTLTDWFDDWNGQRENAVPDELK